MAAHYLADPLNLELDGQQIVGRSNHCCSHRIGCRAQVQGSIVLVLVATMGAADVVESSGPCCLM